jgi:hypothetical protein
MRWFEIEMRRGRLVAVALVAGYRLDGDLCSPTTYMLRGGVRLLDHKIQLAKRSRGDTISDTTFCLLFVRDLIVHFS